jgi:3-isopropylmalate/(R)-2-methylmalate dehydratase large subunit
VIEPWMQQRPGARYADVIRIDCGCFADGGARPAIRATACRSRLAERAKVDIAYGGSCTGGKREDFDHYHGCCVGGRARVARRAGVTLYLQFGTSPCATIARARLPRGVRSGRRGSSAAGLRRVRQLRPGASTDAAQVTVSAINRNFPGARARARCG